MASSLSLLTVSRWRGRAARMTDCKLKRIIVERQCPAPRRDNSVFDGEDIIAGELLPTTALRGTGSSSSCPAPRGAAGGSSPSMIPPRARPRHRAPRTCPDGSSWVFKRTQRPVEAVTEMGVGGISPIKWVVRDLDADGAAGCVARPPSDAGMRSVSRLRGGGIRHRVWRSNDVSDTLTNPHWGVMRVASCWSDRRVSLVGSWVLA